MSFFLFFLFLLFLLLSKVPFFVVCVVRPIIIIIIITILHPSYGWRWIINAIISYVMVTHIYKSMEYNQSFTNIFFFLCFFIYFIWYGVWWTVGKKRKRKITSTNIEFFIALHIISYHIINISWNVNIQLQAFNSSYTKFQKEKRIHL